MSRTKIKFPSLRRDRARTGTPALELGETTTSPLMVTPRLDSAKDGAVGQDGPDEGVQDAAQTAGEDQTLLSSDSASRKSYPRESRWYTVAGYKIPRTLVWLLSVPVLIIFVSILGRSFGPNPTTLPVFSNGTHLFHATTIVTSLDGFKAAYLDEHPDLLPNLISLGNSSLGIRAESMQPCFPTLTFPNHWSMMTGLYPESHGIVANDFWAPATEKQFVLSDRDQSWDPEWWWGEPIWSVAERAGRITANIMWPGPPVTSQGISPTYFIPYDVVEPSVKSKQIFDWLDMPIEVRPHLIFAYLPDTDQKGHLGGPGSTEEEQALSLVDGYIGQLKEGLQARNLTGIVNLIVLSDHGMTSTANERLIFVDDILGEEGYDAIEHRDGWPCVGLRFKEGTDTAPLLDQLLVAAEQSNGAFAVYTRATMPDRWHFNKTDRIAPIYVVPHLGWALTDHHEYEVIHEGDYRPRGNHGYDNIHPDMQAIFFTYGPFAHQLRQADIVGTGDLLSPEPGVLNSFSNLEIYSLVMGMLDLQAVAPLHNGTTSFWGAAF